MMDIVEKLRVSSRRDDGPRKIKIWNHYHPIEMQEASPDNATPMVSVA